VREKKIADANRIINTFETEDGTNIQVLNGRFGPYVTNGQKNASVPKEEVPAELTLERCQELIAAAPDRRRGKKKAAAKKAAAKKTASKKKSASKKKATSKKKSAAKKKSASKKKTAARKKSASKKKAAAKKKTAANASGTSVATARKQASSG
jgi:DNA topoisomerase-1